MKEATKTLQSIKSLLDSFAITRPELRFSLKVLKGKNDKAVEAYETAIRNYPSAPALPEAYYKKGVALRALKRPDEAREAFEFVVKTYPDSFAASLAKQGLAQLGPPARR